MSKSSSDKIFFSYLKHYSPWLKIALVAIGILLVIFSGAFDSEESEAGDEENLAELCSMIEGAGEVRVAISYEQESSYFSSGDEKRVFAVAVFCDGADDVRVRAKIKELISVLYGIGTNRITVN